MIRHMQAAYCYRTWLKARFRASPFILSKRKGQALIVAPASLLNVWTQEIKKAFHAATFCEYKSLSITAKDKAAAKLERREARAPPRKLENNRDLWFAYGIFREEIIFDEATNIGK